MKYFFLALSVVILFTACSKTSTSSNGAVAMLTTGKWKITGGTFSLRKPNGQDTTLTYLNWVPLCHQGDYIRFASPSLGYSYPGPSPCGGEGDSTVFDWSLTNSGSTMSFEGFYFNYAARDSVYGPCYFDTLSKPPGSILELDSLVDKAAATASGGVVVLDSMWNLKFDSVSSSDLNTYNATVVDLTAASFTLNYSVITTYLDTNNHHTGPPQDLSPLVLPDTIHYSVTYSNF